MQILLISVGLWVSFTFIIVTVLLAMNLYKQREVLTTMALYLQRQDKLAHHLCSLSTKILNELQNPLPIPKPVKHQFRRQTQ